MFFGEETKAAVEGVLGTFGKTIKDAVSAFKADPTKAMELDAALAQAEQDFKAKLADIAMRDKEVAAADRDSARKREVELKDTTPRTLAYIVVGGFLGLSVCQLIALYVWPEIKLPSEGWVLIGNITGYLAAKSELALTYYFGTSAGSDRKNDTIERLVNR